MAATNPPEDTIRAYICEACRTPIDSENVVVVRGLADRPGVADICRDCLIAVLLRHRVQPLAEDTVGSRMRREIGGES